MSIWVMLRVRRSLEVAGSQVLKVDGVWTQLLSWSFVNRENSLALNGRWGSAGTQGGGPERD